MGGGALLPPFICGITSYDTISFFRLVLIISILDCGTYIHYTQENSNYCVVLIRRKDFHYLKDEKNMFVNNSLSWEYVRLFSCKSYFFAIVLKTFKSFFQALFWKALVRDKNTLIFPKCIISSTHMY